jgi:hypothetical protein
VAQTCTKNQLFDPKPIKVRLENELLERLKAAARRSLRSVNAEISYRVRSSLEQEKLGAGWLFASRPEALAEAQQLAQQDSVNVVVRP